MKAVALAMSLLIGNAGVALAQTPAANSLFHGGDVALMYEWVHSNTQPGQCGCFGLNGGGVSASWNVGNHWSSVAEVSGQTATGGPETGSSLTLVSYLGGTRYRIPGLPGHHALQPYAQVLAGAGHAGGGIAGAGDGTYAFVGRPGGGIEIPLHSRWMARIEADYDVTTFANSVNQHQNNFLVGAGVVYRWSRIR